MKHPSVSINAPDWQYTDLRALNTTATEDPAQDLIALFTRTVGQALQIRMDFLELGSLPSQDIYIVFDTNPGGEDWIKTTDGNILNIDVNWDYLIELSAHGNVNIMDSSYNPIIGMQLLILRDSSQGSITLSFLNSKIPTQWNLAHMQVLVTKPGQAKIADRTSPISLDSPSPSQIKIVFAFWNTFQAATPAEMLRSWAGAHSGPTRSRHGLKYLLEAADKMTYPIFILDLLKPENLSGLDYLGVLPEIQRLLAQKIIQSPDQNTFYNFTQETNILYGLKSSGKEYEETVNLVKGNINTNGLYNFENIVFINDKYRNNIVVGYDYAQYHLSPCSFTSVTYQDANYLNVCIKYLLSTIQLQPAYPIIIGGDFSESMLGEPGASDALFNYIHTHPWLQVVSIQELPKFINPTISTPLPYLERSSAITYDLYTLPNRNFNQNSDQLANLRSKFSISSDNQITNLAKQIFANLSVANSQKDADFRMQYLTQLNYLLLAANWANSPAGIVNCTPDLDQDHFPDCILATKSIFVVIDAEGGYIPFAFANDQQGIHQIIGPTWEFVPDLGDQSTWNLSRGIRSDPAQILGAFDDASTANGQYAITTTDNSVSISYVRPTEVTKTFTISNQTIKIEIQSATLSNTSIRIPLVLDPWERFYSGWGNRYYVKQYSLSVIWGIEDGISIQITSNHPMTIIAFTDTHKSMLLPEDPNFNYSAGHYLPVPMSVIDIQPAMSYSISITINP